MADQAADSYCTHPVPAGQKKNYHCRPTSRHTMIVPFLNRPAGEIQVHGRPVSQHILYPPSTSWPEKIITADRPADICCTHLVPAGQKRNYHCRPTGRYMLYPPSTGWPEKKLSLQTDRPIYVVPLVPAGQKNNYHCRPTGRHTTIVPFLNRPAGEIQIHGRPVGQHILYPPSTSWPEKIIAADRPADICCTHLVPAGQTK